MQQLKKNFLSVIVLLIEKGTEVDLLIELTNIVHGRS